MAAVLVKNVIRTVRVLDDEQCADVHARIEALRSSWLTRGEDFATIGVAAYLDLMSSSEHRVDYYGSLPAQNALLREHFPDVLEAVRRGVREVTGRGARFEPAVALPGFHVFERDGITTGDWDSFHFDLQHRAVRWPFDLVDEVDLIAVTLPVVMPAAGGGLEWWDFTEEDLKRLLRLGREVTMRGVSRTKPSRVQPYTPGVLSVQMAPVMHRIAAVPRVRDGDQRITLQGHGVLDGDEWVLYW